MKNFTGKAIVLFVVASFCLLTSCNEEVTVKPLEKKNGGSSYNQNTSIDNDLKPITIKKNRDFEVFPETTKVVEIILEK